MKSKTAISLFLSFVSAASGIGCSAADTANASGTDLSAAAERDTSNADPCATSVAQYIQQNFYAQGFLCYDANFYLAWDGKYYGEVVAGEHFRDPVTKPRDVIANLQVEQEASYDDRLYVFRMNVSEDGGESQKPAWGQIVVNPSNCRVPSPQPIYICTDLNECSTSIPEDASLWTAQQAASAGYSGPTR